MSENLRVGDRVVVICSITCGFCRILPGPKDSISVKPKRPWGSSPSGAKDRHYLRRYKDGLSGRVLPRAGG